MTRPTPIPIHQRFKGTYVEHKMLRDFCCISYNIDKYNLFHETFSPGIPTQCTMYTNHIPPSEKKDAWGYNVPRNTCIIYNVAISFVFITTFYPQTSTYVA